MENENLHMLNEAICNSMLNFMKTQKGRLSLDRSDEFSSYVLDLAKQSPEYYLFTLIDLFSKKQADNYIVKSSKDFYMSSYMDGKEKLSKVLRAHIGS